MKLQSPDNKPNVIHTNRMPERQSRGPIPHWIIWLALTFLTLGIAFLLDDHVDPAVQVQFPGSVRSFARCLTQLGDWWPVGLAGLAWGLFYSIRGRLETARGIFHVTLTGLATGLIATLLRSTIGRTRPNADIPQGFFGLWHGGHWIVGQYQFGSFPSGHAATLFGMTVAAWLMSRRAGVGIGLFAMLVSWSRIAQSCHHFSDIVASALLALWISPLLLKIFDAAPRHWFARFHKSRSNEPLAPPERVPRCQNSPVP